VLYSRQKLDIYEPAPFFQGAHAIKEVPGMTRLAQYKATGILVLAAYGFMIGMNILANALPINGLTTGEVSDNFENLFAPTGLTFSIWGLIYLFLGGYTLYQLKIMDSATSHRRKNIFYKITIKIFCSFYLNDNHILFS